ncbi:MAG: class I SAM-dependent methyltransferase [Ferruginibacter sp.]
MHLLLVIRYFFYLAMNWNFRIAFHITKEELRGEKKYGIQSTGADELKTLDNAGIDITHATIYMPASYDMLENIFNQLDCESVKHFIDIGCGKGRVLCVAAHFGMKKISGIDFSKEFCARAKLNIEKVKTNLPHLQYKIHNNDAFYYDIPPDADCIFFFNPFDKVIMSGVINNINTSLEEYPRAMTIIYLNPMSKELFIAIGFKEIYHVKKLNYLEGCILKRER